MSETPPINRMRNPVRDEKFTIEGSGVVLPTFRLLSNDGSTSERLGLPCSAHCPTL